MPTCKIPTSKPTILLNDSTTQFRIEPGSNPNQCIVVREDPPCQQTLNIPCKQVIIQPASAESTDTDRLPASTVTPVLGAAETPKPLTPNAGGGGLQAGSSQPSEAGPTEGAQPAAGVSASAGASPIPLAAVIGGAVGGVVLLLVLVGLFVCMRRRKARARRGRDRYVVQLKSEPDFNEQDEKRYLGGSSPLDSPSASHSSLPRPLSLPRSSLPPPAAVAQSMAPATAMDGRERQVRGSHAYQPQHHQQQYQQQQQYHVRPQSPLPSAQHQRATSPTGPSPVAMSPVEYTPRSTYIPSSPSSTEPRFGQPTPSVHPVPPDSEQQENTYIDLIPVEDTPQISHASLPLPLSSREGGTSTPLRRHEEEQLDEDYSKGHGHEQQGLLRSGAVGSGAGEASSPKAPSKTAALDQDDDEDDDEDIKYL